MEQQRLLQPASRDQIMAIFRQRAERANRPLPADIEQALFPADGMYYFNGRDRVRDADRAVIFRHPPHAQEEERNARLIRIDQSENHLKYAGEKGAPGLYVSGVPLSLERPYFEVEIVNTGSGGLPSGGPVIGLCSLRYPLGILPGWAVESIGYNTGDGKLYKGRPRGQPFGSRCAAGDRIGCGIKMENALGLHNSLVPVFFTRNGKEVGSLLIPFPRGGLFPAIGLQKEQEEVRLLPDLNWPAEDDVAMSVDCGEEEWHRLHDIKLNGQLLEYVGRGKTLVDVGLAQAKTPLCTRSHYFEIEIIDPGSNCYIAIGLARKDYPRNRHPGWNKGSIAYHADDGKVFMGSGVGEPFGPRCNKGDIMGCGVLFPRDYEFRSDSDEESEPERRLKGLLPGGRRPAEQIDLAYRQGEETDSGDEEDWWPRAGIESGEKVQVFFTRNGKIIGKKKVVLPKGGFYPTVGMMSSKEKVRVELRPLSG